MVTYWTEGPRNISMNEVCRRAVASKPSVYREFGSEDGLMEAVLGHYRTTAVRPLIELLAADQPFTEVLVRLLDQLTQASTRPAGCLVAKLRQDPERLGPLTAAALKTITAELHEAYEDWFRRAQINGDVDPAISPDLATHFIDTQLTALLQQMALGTHPSLVRAQAELAFRVLTRTGAD